MRAALSLLSKVPACSAIRVGATDRLTLFRISKQVELAFCSHRCVSPATRLPLLSPLLGSAIDTSSIGHRSSLRSIDYRIGHRSSIAVSTELPGTHGTTGTTMHAIGITMEYDIMEIGMLVRLIPLVITPLDYHSPSASIRSTVYTWPSTSVPQRSHCDLLLGMY